MYLGTGSHTVVPSDTRDIGLPEAQSIETCFDGSEAVLDGIELRGVGGGVQCCVSLGCNGCFDLLCFMDGCIIQE